MPLSNHPQAIESILAYTFNYWLKLSIGPFIIILMIIWASYSLVTPFTLISAIVFLLNYAFIMAATLRKISIDPNAIQLKDFAKKEIYIPWDDVYYVEFTWGNFVVIHSAHSIHKLGLNFSQYSNKLTLHQALLEAIQLNQKDIPVRGKHNLEEPPYGLFTTMDKVSS